MSNRPDGPTRFDIELYSGNYLDLAEPDPEDVTLRDIARGLSNTCRFGGQCSEFYSVAEHAVLVADRLCVMGYGHEVQFAGLHHDDTEAFMGDVVRPLKQLVGGYPEMEARLANRLNGEIPAPWNDAILSADNWALSAEAFHLMPSKGAGWVTAGLYVPGRDDPDHPKLGNMGLTPAVARVLWLTTHRGLKEMCGLVASTGKQKP